MKRQNSPSVSVVVPCYNEEANIASCLSTLTSQELPLHEIIVVDNNSTDKTIKIAKKFKNVKILNEKKQGLIAARDTGLSLSTGDIIARIDADSRPTTDWSKTISESFDDSEIQAITGTGYFYDAPMKKSVRGLRNVVAVHINNRILGHGMLWGSNMALRRTCWLAIKHDVCPGPDIMEDLDLASHIADEFGSKSIAYIPNMRADISARRAMAGLKDNYLYLRMWPKTLSHHGYPASILSWPMVFTLLIAGIPAGVALRFYSFEQDKFILSAKQWRDNSYDYRGNP